MLFLVFEAADCRLALPATDVAEVVPRVRLQALPGLPPAVAGLLNHAGRLVPVVDLESLLQGGRAPDRLSTRIVLARIDGTHADASIPLVGLIAARVDRLREYDAPALEAPSDGWLGAILQWDDAVARVLHVRSLADHLLSGFRIGLPAGAAP
jgi:chemotaxis-related protein WspB